MLDFPNDEWFNIRNNEQIRNNIVYNGLNLFAIWQRHCGIPDKPCPQNIDPDIWKGIHDHLHLWNKLSRTEKQLWHDAAFKLGFHKVIE